MSCGRKIGPFECCSVVQGDSEVLCLNLLGGEVDAVITDPPYGMSWDGKVTRGPNGTGKQGPTKHYATSIVGDNKEFDPSPLFKFKRVVLWGMQHFPQHLERGTVLVWLKRYDDGFGSFLSDADCAWMNHGCGVYCQRDTSLQGEERVHPTQKPVAIMEWCIERAGNPEVILDPFCGSGSTLIAAKKLGRHFLGFEISAEYCDIARKRLAAIDAQPNLFQPKPEQLVL